MLLLGLKLHKVLDIKFLEGISGLSLFQMRFVFLQHFTCPHNIVSFRLGKNFSWSKLYHVCLSLWVEVFEIPSSKCLYLCSAWLGVNFWFTFKLKIFLTISSIFMSCNETWLCGLLAYFSWYFCAFYILLINKPQALRHKCIGRNLWKCVCKKVVNWETSCSLHLLQVAFGRGLSV